METFTLSHANALISPTWHSLAMNDVDIELPADLISANTTTIEAPETLFGSETAFDTALGDHLAAFETGMGPTANAYLRERAQVRHSLVTHPGEQIVEPVIIRIDGADRSLNAVAVDIVAAEGSHISVILASDSPHPGSGVVGSSIRVFAGTGAQVTLTTVQTLDDSWISLDNTGLFLEDNARVDVRHTVLGAGKAFVGLAGDLHGYAAEARVDTRYLGHGSQEIDFNYLMRHHGTKTTCHMEAQGVLTGESHKILRGTIDLVRGCKGADGYESETVLLADERVQNKTIPIILCGEDDVAGNHGATIGHVRPEQLAYLSSRGLSQSDAERLFASATFEEAALSVSDSRIRTSIARLASTLSIPFEEVTA